MIVRRGSTYRDRVEAGRKLAGLLSAHKGTTAVVFALPRGGIPVAIEVARALSLPIDLLYVRKLGAPLRPELAVGAVVDGPDPDIVINEAISRRLGVSKEVIRELAKHELEEIKRRKAHYGPELPPPLNPIGRIAIVVDDGLATGATVRAAVQALRRRGATRVIVAVPVAPTEAVAEVEAAGADVVCPLVSDDFRGVGEFYGDFNQLSDQYVLTELRAFHRDAESRSKFRSVD